MIKKNILLIGTHNDGKFKEISKLISKKIKKISPKSLKIKAPKETGKTFKLNSELKANFFFKKSKLISISDDSGLEILALKKKPGIYSARWGGPKGDFNLAIKKVFKALDKKKKNWREKKISARFICALTIFGLKKKPIFSVGKIEGYISNEQRGLKGFGYDPIFIPKGKRKTFGEIDPKKKYKIDHRYKAFKKIRKFL